MSAARHATRSHSLFLFCSFYKSNHVQKFHYSRPVRRGAVDPENEFAVSIPHPSAAFITPSGHLDQPEQSLCPPNSEWGAFDPKLKEVGLTSIDRMTRILQSLPLSHFLSLSSFKIEPRPCVGWLFNHEALQHFQGTGALRLSRGVEVRPSRKHQ